MKKILLVIVISLSAMANLENVYMQKVESTGHVLPEYAKTKTCTIYFNGIVTYTKFHYTGVVKKEVNNYGIVKNSRLDKIVEAAFDGVQLKEVYPADANSVKYVAGFKKGEEERIVTLLNADGANGTKTTNDAIQAKRLVVLIEELCK